LPLFRQLGVSRGTSSAFEVLAIKEDSSVIEFVELVFYNLFLDLLPYLTKGLVL